MLLFFIIKLAATPRICTTSACILAASQIVSQIDPSADPCEDFFQFACGNFIRNSHGDVNVAPMKQINAQIKRQLSELIMEPITEDENQWIRSQKAFFQGCMNKTAAEEESLGTFKNTLEDLNGWPVVVGYQWNESAFDWKYMIYKLRDKGYSYSHSNLLEVGVVEDPANTNRHILVVEYFQAVPGDVRKVRDEHKQLYKAYMTDVAVMFGADKNRAHIEMEKVFDFRENLRKIYEDVYLTAENKNKTLNFTAILLEGRMTVKKYQKLYGDFEWLDFINTILYPVGEITSDDYVLFPKLELTKAVIRLINSTNKRILANYMIWTVIEEIMPFMTKELEQLSGNYTCLTGRFKSDKTRYEYCSHLISNSYYDFSEPVDIMYARKYLPINQRKKVQEIFANVKLELISVLQKVSWMDKESKTKALEKARDIVGIIGAPADYFNDGGFKQLWGDNYTEVQNDSFFAMHLYLQKRKKNSIFLHYLHVNDTKLDKFYKFIASVKASYYPTDNAVIIPVGILQGVFYNENRPMYLNYGAVGSVIGHELTHGFDGERSSYEKDGHLIHVWTDATRKAYKEKSKCIVKEADEFLIGDSEFQNGTSTLDENLADYTGLKVSYAAYQKWIQENGKEPQLPQINYTPNQLFWISSIAHRCFKIDEMLDPYHAHNLFRATAPLRNNPYFAKDFNCPLGSKMNPPEKCQVY